MLVAQEPRPLPVDPPGERRHLVGVDMCLAFITHCAKRGCTNKSSAMSCSVAAMRLWFAEEAGIPTKRIRDCSCPTDQHKGE